MGAHLGVEDIQAVDAVRQVGAYGLAIESTIYTQEFLDDELQQAWDEFVILALQAHRAEEEFFAVAGRLSGEK